LFISFSYLLGLFGGIMLNEEVFTFPEVNPNIWGFLEFLWGSPIIAASGEPSNPTRASEF
jgi:hypothetical protein